MANPADIARLAALLRRSAKAAEKPAEFIAETGHRANAVKTTGGLAGTDGHAAAPQGVVPNGDAHGAPMAAAAHAGGHNLADLGFEYGQRTADVALGGKIALAGAARVAPAAAAPLLQAGAAKLGSAALGLGSRFTPAVYGTQMATQTLRMMQHPETIDTQMETVGSDVGDGTLGGSALAAATRAMSGLANPTLTIAAAGKGIADTVGSYLGAAGTDMRNAEMQQKIDQQKAMLAAKSLGEVSTPIPAPMYGGGGRTQTDMRKKRLLAKHDAALTALDAVTPKTAPGIDPAEVEVRRKALLASRSEAENWKDGPKLNTRTQIASK